MHVRNFFLTAAAGGVMLGLLTAATTPVTMNSAPVPEWRKAATQRAFQAPSTPVVGLPEDLTPNQIPVRADALEQYRAEHYAAPAIERRQPEPMAVVLPSLPEPDPQPAEPEAAAPASMSDGLVVVGATAAL